MLTPRWRGCFYLLVGFYLLVDLYLLVGFYLLADLYLLGGFYLLVDLNLLVHSSSMLDRF